MIVCHFSSAVRLAFKLGILTISLGSLALAQAPTVPVTDNIVQPYFYPAPPVGFNPVTASDADLRAYGFPRRPLLSDSHYATWAKAMANAKSRVANPIAVMTNRVHRPPQIAERAPQGVSGGAQLSYTWSGVAVTYAYAYFAQEGSTVVTNFTVPNIGQENCSYGPYRLFMWAGFDGAIAQGGNDVLQAGVVAQACPATYTAVYEWYTDGCIFSSASQPCYETSLNLPVHAGDVIYMTVGYDPQYTNPGTAYLQNQTTGQYISVGFSQPSGSQSTRYAGYSAEWVLERDSYNGTPYNLANYYLANPSPNGALVNMTAQYWTQFNPTVQAGGDPASTVNTYGMVCAPDTWNPSSQCPRINGFLQSISQTSFWGPNDQPPPGYYPGVVYFTVAGPALNGNQ